MKKITVILSVAMAVLASVASDLETIRTRFCELEIATKAIEGHISAKPQPVEKLLSTLSPDGSWSNIDYSDGDPSLWGPAISHFGNLTVLVKEWYLKRDAKLEDAIHRSFGFWLEKDFKNSNWWWNQIGVPSYAGTVSILFNDALTDKERQKAIEIMKRAQFKMSGQNRIWLAKVNLMRALVSNDEALAKKASDVIGEELRLSNYEGIRADWCFHQHGRQPQFGNYGLSYVGNMSRFAVLFANTSLAFPEEKVMLLKNLIEQGYDWIIWKGYMDVPSLCRQLFPGASRGKAKAIIGAKNTLKKAGIEFNPEPPVGFKYFHCSALGYYRTKNWMASVKMATTDIIGVETWINGDNVLGGHMADGALYTMVSGKEYEDIFPLWGNWRLIPGITTYVNYKPVYQNKPQGPKHFSEYGANWSNKVSGEKTATGGTVTMELKREGLVAQKKWEFSDSAILCTGEGISSSDPNGEVVTCLEHSHAAANVKIFKSPDGTTRALNGKIGYVIDAPCDDVHVAVEDRSGDFTRFMKSVKSKTVKGKVFVAYVKHGKKPENAKYRYWVLPDTTEAKLKEFSTGK